MAMVDGEMKTWVLQRRYVSAQSLGTNTPWIHPPLYIEAVYYTNNDGTFVEFKDGEHKVVYSIQENEVYSIEREDADVSERSAEAEPEVISLAEAARMLFCSRQSALALMYDKKILGLKYGDTYVVTLSSVKERVKKSEKTS